MPECDGCHGVAPAADLKTCDDPSCVLTAEEQKTLEMQTLCNDCLTAHKNVTHKPDAVVKAEQKAQKLSKAAAEATKKAEEAKADADAKAQAAAASEGVITGDKAEAPKGKGK